MTCSSASNITTADRTETSDYSDVAWASLVSLITNNPIFCSTVCSTSHQRHYYDVIMGTIASQITSLTVVYSTIYSDVDQRKHQSSASLAFVRGIHRGPVNSPHKWPVTRKMFPFDDVIMEKKTNKTPHRRSFVRKVVMRWKNLQNLQCFMSHENAFRIAGRLWCESTSSVRFPSQRTCKADLCYFLWC